MNRQLLGAFLTVKSQGDYLSNSWKHPGESFLKEMLLCGSPACSPAREEPSQPMFNSHFSL